MNYVFTKTHSTSLLWRLQSVALATALFATTTAALQAAVLPPQSNPLGKSYAQWSAAWWQWSLALPVENHPSIDTADIDVTAGQSGNVWFLASTFGTMKRDVTIPAGTALFIGMLNVETSSLEAAPFFGATEAEQRAIANSFADLIVDVSFSIDGRAVPNIEAFRVESPQFEFTAPTPWIFGPTGGTGTSVADGYYVMVTPLPKGVHTIQYSGAFRYSDAPGDESLIDMTYSITVK